MIKIKVECWWTDSNSIHQRILKQFVFEKDLSKYQFVLSNPDYTIILGRTDWNKLETSKERTFYFSQEPLWSPNQPKEDIHNYCSKIFISDKRDYPDSEEYIETLLPMLYAGHGETDNRKEWDWSTDLKSKRFTKNKKMSIIVRKDHYSHYNHLVNPITSQIIYELRTNLGVELSKNEEIDVFGTYWEKNNKNIKGEVWNKHVGLDDYKFSIGCENSVQKNYITEKFWDIILADCIPIYLGCTNITDYIPENCFINLNNLTMKEMIEKIEDILINCDDYYNLYKKNIFELKEEFFSNPTYNLWEKIKFEINNV